MPNAQGLTPSPEAGLRLAALLMRFWVVRGYLAEGRERLGKALAAAPEATAGRAKALNAAGILAYRQADYHAARLLYEESLAIVRTLGDQRGIAAALNNLGMLATDQGDPAGARPFYEESLAIKREIGDRWGIATSLNNLGIAAYRQGEYEAARALYEESLAIRRELADRWGVAGALNNLGMIAHQQGDFRAARSLHEESLSIRRELGDRIGAAASLEALAELAYEGNDQGGGGEPPEGSPVEDWRRAARLFAAGDALREAGGALLPVTEQEENRRQVSRVRELLGEEAFAAAWEEGRAKSLEEAVAYALAETSET
jgi:tetratricopeptide (TPR) repeat protein